MNKKSLLVLIGIATILSGCSSNKIEKTESIPSTEESIAEKTVEQNELNLADQLELVQEDEAESLKETVTDSAEDKIKGALSCTEEQSKQIYDGIKSKIPTNIDLALIDIETENEIILRIIDDLGDSYFVVMGKDFNIKKITYDSIENDPL